MAQWMSSTVRERSRSGTVTPRDSASSTIVAVMFSVFDSRRLHLIDGPSAPPSSRARSSRGRSCPKALGCLSSCTMATSRSSSTPMTRRRSPAGSRRSSRGSSSAPTAPARFFAADRCRARSRSGSPHRRCRRSSAYRAGGGRTAAQLRCSSIASSTQRWTCSRYIPGSGLEPRRCVELEAAPSCAGAVDRVRYARRARRTCASI